MHTNGKTVYRSFTLSRNCKPLHSTYYSAFNNNNNYNSNISKNYNNNNGNKSNVVNPSSSTQKLLKNEIQNSLPPNNPPTGFAIKKSSSCSSFLVDILFRGICPKRSKMKCILFFFFFIISTFDLLLHLLFLFSLILFVFVFRLS